jgi:hypothetical protein
MTPAAAAVAATARWDSAAATWRWTNTDEVSLFAANLFANVADSGAIDVHSASVAWLDKTGERLTMRISKTDVKG